MDKLGLYTATILTNLSVRELNENFLSSGVLEVRLLEAFLVIRYP